MSTLAANNITDAAGTGGPTLANGLTIGTSPLAAPSGSAPSYTCRAWVNFNGTGTVAIREDGNVSSITDNGTGDYTVNFATAMPDTDYAMVGTPSSSDTTTIPGGLMQSTATGGADFTRTTSSITVRNARTSTGAAADAGSINIAIFR